MRPDLTLYRPHREAFDVSVEGVPVPGLHATYFSRPDSGRVATVGVYRFTGVEVFMAWGYADEAHCRWTAYRQPDGSWTEPRSGCPDPTHTLSLIMNLRSRLTECQTT
ncbi:MAG: hypothetical protein HOU81_23505 [Hamadaea sp.]|uniref:hypothetical protein n=1 Tax=Hamadaea sp. TaxID=2024425 RepID=UPI0017BA121D|nr:hypothetical protein [Hamadaea sp.]NUR73791.1 hypothetical protein [Hamadaea sp.]NUT22403.1 hypothetical protein [Hamadaea sp.]